MDNEPTFKGNELRYFCKELKINQAFSSPYYTQANGLVESTNKTLISILSKIVSKHGRN